MPTSLQAVCHSLSDSFQEIVIVYIT